MSSTATGTGPATDRPRTGPALTRTQRWTLAALVPLAPLANAAWAAAVPYEISDPPQVWIAKALAAPERMDLAMTVYSLFAFAGLLSVLVLGAVARRGAPRLGTVAVVLAFVGTCAAILNGFGIDGVVATGAAAGLDVPALQSLVDAHEGLLAVQITGPLFLLMPLGTLLLGVALWVGRTVPVWAAAAITLGSPVVLIGGFVLHPLLIAGWLVIAAGYVAAAAAFART